MNEKEQLILEKDVKAVKNLCKIYAPDDEFGRACRDAVKEKEKGGMGGFEFLQRLYGLTGRLPRSNEKEKIYNKIKQISKKRGFNI